MDFQFSFDTFGKPIARCSMDHEAVANWINSEIDGDLHKLNELLQLVNNIQQHPHIYTDHLLIGREFSLSLNNEEVMIQANHLNFSQETLEEGLNYYDQESLSFCGLDDFEHFLLQYRTFAQLAS